MQRQAKARTWNSEPRVNIQLSAGAVSCLVSPANIVIQNSLRPLCVLGVSAVNVFEICSPPRRRDRRDYAENGQNQDTLYLEERICAVKIGAMCCILSRASGSPVGLSTSSVTKDEL